MNENVSIVAIVALIIIALIFLFLILNAKIQRGSRGIDFSLIPESNVTPADFSMNPVSIIPKVE
jgi:hypothetical protein